MFAILGNKEFHGTSNQVKEAIQEYLLDTNGHYIPRNVMKRSLGIFMMDVFDPGRETRTRIEWGTNKDYKELSR